MFSWQLPVLARNRRSAPHERATTVGDRGQGVAPAQSRPHHAGDDPGHSDDAAGAVRLRDQLQPAWTRRRHRRSGQYRRLARAGDGHAGHRRGLGEAHGEHAGAADGDDPPRRHQHRHRGATGFRAPPHRRPAGGAGAGRRQRHHGAERGGPAGADAAGQRRARPARTTHQHAADATDQRGQLLQSAAGVGDQHRAGADRRDHDDDDGAVHRDRDRA